MTKLSDLISPANRGVEVVRRYKFTGYPMIEIVKELRGYSCNWDFDGESTKDVEQWVKDEMERLYQGNPTEICF